MKKLEPHELDKRNREIVRMYKVPHTLAEIGEEFGISRERVRQILDKNGVTRWDGGQAVRTRQRRETKKAELLLKRERQCRRVYGCSREEYLAIQGDDPTNAWGSPAAIFLRQRRNAKRRGILWRLSFTEWWSFWKDSGLWEYQGRGADQYGLGRIDFNRGFEIDNVVVRTNGESSRIYQMWRKEQ